MVEVYSLRNTSKHFLPRNIIISMYEMYFNSYSWTNCYSADLQEMARAERDNRILHNVKNTQFSYSYPLLKGKGVVFRVLDG